MISQYLVCNVSMPSKSKYVSFVKVTANFKTYSQTEAQKMAA